MVLTPQDLPSVVLLAGLVHILAGPIVSYCLRMLYELTDNELDDITNFMTDWERNRSCMDKSEITGGSGDQLVE